MDIRERMKNGKLYFCTDESVAREQLQCLDKLYDFNQTRPSEMEKRQSMRPASPMVRRKRDFFEVYAQ